MADPVIIRDAASVVLVRDTTGLPSVLMGQRGAGAAFMPSKFVFPGGAVDPCDALVQTGSELSPACSARLSVEPTSPSVAPKTLALAAIRELWEETGLALSCAASEHCDLPPGWRGFPGDGYAPDLSALNFFFRAITPPGRPRRFDARFFLADAAHIRGDIDDFSLATDELSHLQWVPLDSAHDLDLPNITRLVLSELKALLPRVAPPPAVPFYENGTLSGEVRYL